MKFSWETCSIIATVAQLKLYKSHLKALQLLIEGEARLSQEKVCSESRKNQSDLEAIQVLRIYQKLPSHQITC